MLKKETIFANLKKNKTQKMRRIRVTTKNQETVDKRRMDTIELFLINIKTNMKFIKIQVNTFDVKSINLTKNTITTKCKLNQ